MTAADSQSETGSGTGRTDELGRALAGIRARFRTAADIAKLSPGERMLIRVVLTLDAEIQNGGIDQYLRNASGDDAEQVIQDLSVIGAIEPREVLTLAATQWFAGRIPGDTDERFDQLVAAEERDATLFARQEHELTRRYRAGRGELYARLQEYVKRHPEEFPAIE